MAFFGNLKKEFQNVHDKILELKAHFESKLSLIQWLDEPYGECESQFLEMIGIIVSREQEDEVRDGLYEAR